MKKVMYRMALVFFVLPFIFSMDPNIKSTLKNINVQLKYGLSARQGDRATMEDAHTFCDEKKYQFLSLFDGHYGDLAACYAANNMPIVFFSQINVHGDIDKALYDSFVLINNEIIQLNNHSGTTALSMIYQPTTRRIYIGSIGDSRAIAFRNGEIFFATEDHNVKNIKEYQRLEKTDCVVFNQVDWDNVTHTLKSGEIILTPRFLWKIDAISESTRSLGDGRFNDYVIGQPDITMWCVERGDIIIAACDGVWDVMDNKTAVSIVIKALKTSLLGINNNYSVTPMVERGERVGVQDTIYEFGNERMVFAARVLRDEAYARGSTDNISVLILSFE